MQGIGDPAERTDIIRICGFVADQAVARRSGQQARRAVDMDRRMHQKVQHDEERQPGFPSPQTNHAVKYAMSGDKCKLSGRVPGRGGQPWLEAGVHNPVTIVFRRKAVH